MNLLRKSVVGTLPHNDTKTSEKLNNGSTRMLLLIDELNNLTSKTKDILFDRFVKHLPFYSLERLRYDKNSEKLENDFQMICNDFTFMKTGQEIEDINVQKIVNDLRNAYMQFQMCSVLVDCNRSLSQASICVQRLQFDKAAVLLDDILAKLQKNYGNESWKEIISNMRKLTCLKRSLCVSKLCEEWEECLLWEERHFSDKVTLSISIQKSNQTHTKMIMQALSKAKQLDTELAPFSTFFIDKILFALLNKNCIISCDETMNFVHLVIEHSDIDEFNPQVHVFIENLMVVLEFLQSNLNFDFENGDTFLSSMAKLMSKPFFKFIDQYFASCVPSSVEQLSEFDKINAEISMLNTFLHGLKFTDKEYSPLYKYIQSSELLINKKKCENYLLDAKEIVMENLQQNVIKIGCDGGSDKTVFFNAEALESPFLLPKMKISSNVKRLMFLVLNCLREASKCPNRLATDLVLTVKNMFSLFSSLVPHCQEQNLKNNALDVALFYNNCHYLSHCMLSAPWGIELEDNLVKSLNVFMANQIHILKTISDCTLSQFIKAENKLIVNDFNNIDMKTLDLSCGVPDLDDSIGDAQARLVSLKRQWCGVLSAETYTKTMENLVKSVCHAVLDCLIRIDQEGLAMESSNALAICLEPAVQCPLLVLEDEAKPLKSHAKLKDIVDLLSYPRKAVFEEKLASEGVWKTFSKSEMKFLIKLVFPVGAVRSALIARIQ